MKALWNLALVCLLGLGAHCCPLETYRPECGNITYNAIVVAHGDDENLKWSPARTPELCCHICLVNTVAKMGKYSPHLTACYYWEYTNGKGCQTYHFKGFGNIVPHYKDNILGKLPDVSFEEKLSFKRNLRSSLEEPLYCGEFLAANFFLWEDVINQFTSFFQLSRGIISAGATNSREMRESWRVGPFEGIERVEMHKKDCTMRAIGRTNPIGGVLRTIENATLINETAKDTVENGPTRENILWEWKAPGEKGCQLKTEPLQVVIRNSQGRMLWHVRDGYKAEWLDKGRKNCASQLEFEGDTAVLNGRIFDVTEVGAALYDVCLSLVSAAHKNRSETYLTAEEERTHCCVERAENATMRGGFENGRHPIYRIDGIKYVEALFMKFPNGSWIWNSTSVPNIFKELDEAYKFQVFVSQARDRKKKATWEKNREKNKKESFSSANEQICCQVPFFGLAFHLLVQCPNCTGN